MIWHEVQSYTAGPLPRNGAGSLADGRPWVSIPLSRNGFTNSRNLPCIRTLYKQIFNATNQLATRFICTKRVMHHG